MLPVALRSSRTSATGTSQSTTARSTQERSRAYVTASNAVPSRTSANSASRVLSFSSRVARRPYAFQPGTTWTSRAARPKRQSGPIASTGAGRVAASAGTTSTAKPSTTAAYGNRMRTASCPM